MLFGKRVCDQVNYIFLLGHRHMVLENFYIV